MRAVSTDPNTVLLVEEVTLSASDRLLILHSDDPAQIVALGKQAAQTIVFSASFTALNKMRQQVTARATPNVSFCEDVFPSGAEQFDVAVMTVPKGRDYARGLVHMARQKLRPGGKLYMAGPTDGGAKSLIADATIIFGNASTLAYRRRSRVGVAVQPESPAVYPSQWGSDPTRIQVRQIGGLSIATMPGVFSWEHLDEGTALLLDHLPLESGERVLDVGCGYGVIGLSMAHKGASRVVLTDDNLLAVRCAKASAEAAGFANVEVTAGDVYSNVGDDPFDLIVSNPPFHQKFDVNTNVAHRIMREAALHLAPGGRLVIVANAFLKYDALMAEHLNRVRTIATDGRYIVLEGFRPATSNRARAADGSAPAERKPSKRKSRQAAELAALASMPTLRPGIQPDDVEDSDLDDLFSELEALERSIELGTVSDANDVLDED